MKHQDEYTRRMLDPERILTHTTFDTIPIGKKTSNGVIMTSILPGLYKRLLYEVKEFEDKTMYSPLTENHIYAVGETMVSIIDAAKENTEESFKIMHISEAISCISPIPLELQEEFPMYVVTNKKMHHGAGVIEVKGSIEKIQRKIKSEQFFLLPSSIHEVIIVPSNIRTFDPLQLGTMVREVNETEVDPKEKLSDFAYFFNGKEYEIIDQ